MFTDLISLSEAKERNLIHYFSGKECKNGHVSKRLVSTRQCLECVKEHASNFRRKTKKNNGGEVFYFDGIPCSKGHISKKYSAGNACLECCKLSSKKYREHNKEKAKERLRAFKKRHADRVNANTAFRRANKKKATPSWLTKEMLKEIRHFYTEAKKRSEETGIAYDVDHIVPLNGETVSGLHVPWNLRVIPKTENLLKSNRLLEKIVWPDM